MLIATVAGERHDRLARADRGGHRLDRDREQDQAGAVVEEALAVDRSSTGRAARAGA